MRLIPRILSRLTKLMHSTTAKEQDKSPSPPPRQRSTGACTPGCAKGVDSNVTRWTGLGWQAPVASAVLATTAVQTPAPIDTGRAPSALTSSKPTLSRRNMGEHLQSGAQDADGLGASQQRHAASAPLRGGSASARKMTYSGSKMTKRLPSVPEPAYGDPLRLKRQTHPSTARKRSGEAPRRGPPLPQRTSLAKQPPRRRRRASDWTPQKWMLNPMLAVAVI